MIRKVGPIPIPSAIERNVSETIKFETQHTVADMPPQMPRYSSGYISELRVHGTGPIPGEKKPIYKAKPTTASHPYNPFEDDDCLKNAKAKTINDTATPARLERANFFRPAWSIR
ncbi:hypothetical protein V8G54_020618 [Vigna mungo]|uniref:Uncharacterized protein n=1 Tax=Vigna mungo TaxID=3915 RepID=A0AAQ3NCR4_VIGMU